MEQPKEGESLVERLIKERSETAESVMEFDFNKKRVKILSDEKVVKENASCVMYWMTREMRVQDNWSFLFAQKLALKFKTPLHVFFFLIPKFLNATVRHYKFMLEGLQEVSTECKSLNIPFHLQIGSAEEHLPKIVKDHNIGAVVCDFSPLREARSWQDKVLKDLPADVPFCLVDGHNIVPCWETSNKQEYAARTIRTKVMSQVPTYLTPFPPLIKHPYSKQLDLPEFDWSKANSNVQANDDGDEVTWIKAGYKQGINMLDTFCSKRLQLFADKRNDPTINALSNLSPWQHFGQIAPQRCILEVSKYKKKYLSSVNAYVEENIVRRELSDNFCYYNPDYDNINGSSNWARETLLNHKKDKRSYLYLLDEFEKAKTHDPLWNSAQLELTKTGKMHGFLRMYWAKKILEWSESPEQAIEIAIYLNDHYSLDGRDPNGYVGILWSICGIHDQGWMERPVFGKIRYMNFEGCKRKFKIDAYIARWGGKAHNTPRNSNTDLKVSLAGKKKKKDLTSYFQTSTTKSKTKSESRSTRRSSSNSSSDSSSADFKPSPSKKLKKK